MYLDDLRTQTLSPLLSVLIGIWFMDEITYHRQSMALSNLLRNRINTRAIHHDKLNYGDILLIHLHGFRLEPGLIV